MASSSLSPDIDTTVRFGRIPTCDLSAVVCGGVADRQKVVILATATAQVHVLSLRDDAAPHRTFALIVSATGAHRRAPIISLRADEDYMYMLQSPSNRVLYTSMTMDGVVLQIQAGQAAITAIDVVGNSQIMIGDADGRTTLWSLAAHGPIWSYSALTLNDAITAIAACDDVVFAAAKSGTIVIRNALDGTLQCAISTSSVSRSAIAWRNRTSSLFADADGNIRVVSPGEGSFSVAHEWKEDAAVVSMDTGPMHVVAIGLANGIVSVRDLDGGCVLAQLACNSAVVALAFLGFNREGEPTESPQLLVALYDGSVEVWPIATSADALPDSTCHDELDARRSLLEPSNDDVSAEMPESQVARVESATLGSTKECAEASTQREEAEADAGFFSDEFSDAAKADEDDDSLLPRAGPAPLPEPEPQPAVHVGAQSGDSTVPRPTPPLPPVGRFTSAAKIKAVLSSGATATESDSVLARPAPNSTLWLQHHRNELMSSAMTEAPFVDESTVRERAATKVAFSNCLCPTTDIMLRPFMSTFEIQPYSASSLPLMLKPLRRPRRRYQNKLTRSGCNP